MTSIKHILVIGLLAAFLVSGYYVVRNYQLKSAEAGQSCESTPTAHTLQLCDRLIRFGQVAYDRGQFAEAKHFFQKAIMVYPSNVAAWKKYNMALLSLISAKVETDPAFLPELVPDTGSRPTKQQKDRTSSTQDDGC